MAKKKQVFRKVALERLSSPEQLDQLLQVTDPKAWIALVALCLLLLTALGWGIWGTLPTEAIGQGILLRQGGVSELAVAASGQVEEILVSVGDEIVKGQTVATIRQEALERRIQDARTRLEARRLDERELQRYTEEQKRLSTANLQQRGDNLRLSITTIERELELLNERIELQRELLDDGLITQQTLLDTERRVNTANDQLAAARLELNGLDLRRLEDVQKLDQQLEVRRSEIRDLELALRELEASLDENVQVTATESGRVLELMADRGDVVQPGAKILSMEVVSEELIAVVFVPANLGKQVIPGMDARIAPSSVQREEYGFMLGEVTWVSEFPSTRRGILQLLANEELADRLLEAGPPIQINVRLLDDPSTPTGFRWSSSSGPDLSITSGTLTEGSVVVRQDRPISLIIPTLREATGL